MAKILDLDVLRPQQVIVKLAGEEIDVSFIPTGLTFDIEAIVREMATLDMSKLREDGEETRRAFDLSVKLCSAFATWKHPEMTPEWFYENTSAVQIEAFADAVKDALGESLKGAEMYKKK